jgi:hypothetical protein
MLAMENHQRSSEMTIGPARQGKARQGKARQGPAGFSVLTEMNPKATSDPDLAFTSICPRSILAHRKPISCNKEITASNQGLTDRFASKVLDA